MSLPFNYLNYYEINKIASKWKPFFTVALALVIVSCNRIPRGEFQKALSINGGFHKINNLGYESDVKYSLNVTLKEIESNLINNSNDVLLIATIEIENTGKTMFNLTYKYFAEDGFYVVLPDKTEFRQLDKQKMDRSGIRMGYHSFEPFHWDDMDILPMSKSTYVVPFRVPSSIVKGQFFIKYLAFSKDKSVPLFEISTK